MPLSSKHDKLLLALCLIAVAMIPGCSTTPQGPKVLEVKRRVVTEPVPAGMQVTKMPGNRDTTMAFELMIGFNELHYKKEIYEVLENGKPVGTREGEEIIEKMVQNQILEKLTGATFDRIVLGETVVKEGAFKDGILTVDYAHLFPGLNPYSKKDKITAYFTLNSKEKVFTTWVVTEPLWKISKICEANAALEKDPTSPLLLLKLILCHIRAGDRKDGLKGAESLFARAGKEYDKELYDTMAEAYAYAGEYVKGARLYEMIYREDKDFFARIKAMSYYTSGGQLAQAQALAFEALAENPDDSVACSVIGDVRRGCFQYGLAVWWYRRSLALQPDDDLKSRLATLENSWKKKNSGSPATIYGEKIKAYNQELGSLASRVKSRHKAWKDNPGYGRGMIEKQVDELKQRAETVKRELASLTKKYDDMAALFNKGIKEWHNKNYEKAIALLDDVLRHDFRMGYARVLEAQIYGSWGKKFLGKGDFDGAAKMFIKALNMEGRVYSTDENGKPEKLDLAECLATVYWRQGYNKKPESKERIELWNGAHTFAPENRLYRAHLCAGMHSTELARETVSNARNLPQSVFKVKAENLGKDLGDGSLEFWLGHKFMKENKYKNARETLQTALSKKETAEAYQLLTYLYAAEGLGLKEPAVFAKKAAELHGKKQAYQASQKDYNHKEAAGRCWALYSAILVGQAYAHFEKQDSKKAEKAIKQALEAAQQAYKLHPEGKFSRHLAPVLEAEIEALERGRLTPEK